MFWTIVYYMLVSTEQQKEANRRNGGLSNGPKTEEGKAVSSKNSLRHGLLSSDVVLPDEDAEAFAQTSERLRENLNPLGELESLLADRIIRLDWRLRRLGKIEAAILWWQHSGALAEREGSKITVFSKDIFPAGKSDGNEIARSKLQEHRAQQESELATYGAGFIRDSSNEKALSTLSRYETSLERSMYKALHELQRLQAARQGKPVPVPVVVDIDLAGDEHATALDERDDP
jgi:hypothetical protein